MMYAFSYNAIPFGVSMRACYVCPHCDKLPYPGIPDDPR
jgi:hypothetical protein